MNYFPAIRTSVLAFFCLTLLSACAAPSPRPSEPMVQPVDLSGEWQYQDETTIQQIRLDSSGNGNYAWQNGHIATTSVSEGRWLGTWHQEANDREGGFELNLSEDRTEAEGSWWYTRIGTQTIPPHTQGGTFRLSRVNGTALRRTP